MDRTELENKIKTMKLDELTAYHGAAKSTSRVLDVIGVSICFGMIAFTSIFTIIPGAIFLYIMSQISAGICKTVTLIEERIEALSGK